MTAEIPWPPEAREAVARRCYNASRDVLRLLGALAPVRDVSWCKAEQWVRDCQIIEADAALAALAPFVAAMIEEAKRKDPHAWRGEGPAPARWTAPDGTIVYRSYEDYVND